MRIRMRNPCFVMGFALFLREWNGIESNRIESNALMSFSVDFECGQVRKTILVKSSVKGGGTFFVSREGGWINIGYKSVVYLCVRVCYTAWFISYR